MPSGFNIEYVVLPNGRIPAQEFLDSVDDDAAAKVLAFLEQLRIYGNQMPAKYVTKLSANILELRVKHFDRIFRVLFFFQPGMLIVITSGFQKSTQRTPPAEIARAERLRAIWLRYRNRYPESEKARQLILKEAGI